MFPLGGQFLLLATPVGVRDGGVPGGVVTVLRVLPCGSWDVVVGRTRRSRDAPSANAGPPHPPLLWHRPPPPHDVPPAPRGCHHPSSPAPRGLRPPPPAYAVPLHPPVDAVPLVGVVRGHHEHEQDPHVLD